MLRWRGHHPSPLSVVERGEGAKGVRGEVRKKFPFWVEKNAHAGVGRVGYIRGIGLWDGGGHGQDTFDQGDIGDGDAAVFGRGGAARGGGVAGAVVSRGATVLVAGSAGR